MRWKREGRISFVPTMGNLHEGHLKLIETASQYGEKRIVSIFVNPLQFGPNEDFEKYPRTFEADVEKLERAQIDLLFCPQVADLYPLDFSTKIQVSGLTEPLCGASRPGHFDGVATVCVKLFNITLADFAVFGKKDFQQLRIIEKVVSDLNLPVKIIPHETVRESDGLAFSSRNQYLSVEERKVASHIPRALGFAKEIGLSPQVTLSQIEKTVRDYLKEFPLELEYVEVANEKDLISKSMGTLLSEVAIPRLFIAARIGKTRLIDNISLRACDKIN